MRKLNTLQNAGHRLLPKCDRWKRHNYRLIAKPVLEWIDIQKPEYPDIFDGTSKLGEIVNCEGVLLRREKGTCSDCHLMTFDYTDCCNTTNCESDCFKPYVPEIE